MSFFDKFLECLGFEGDGEKKPKKEKQKKAPSNNGLQFNLDKQAEPTENINKSSSPEIENPKSQAEVQSIIDKVQEGKTVIVNLSGFNATDRIRALDFLSGCVYILRGKMQSLEVNLYIIYPN